MSVQSALRRVRIAPAAADLFAVPGVGWVYPQFESAEAAWGRKFYARKLLASDQDHFQGVLGERDTGLKLGLELRGFGGAVAGAGNGIVAGDGDLGLLLRTVFGNQTKDTGALTAAGSTLAAITLAAGKGATFTVGGFVGLVGSDGLYYVRQIRSKAGDVLTLDRGLPATAFGAGPAAGVVCYASATYTKATQGHQPLFADVEGYDPVAANNWRRYLYGLLGTCTLKNLAANGQAKIDFDLKGVHWDDAAEGTSQGAPAWTPNLPASGGFVRQSRLNLGASVQAVHDVDFEIGNDVQPKASISAKNGIASMWVKDSKATMKFSAYHDDGGAALRASWESQTLVDVLLELTQGGPGNSFAIAAPFVLISACKPKSVGGLDAYEFDCEITRNDTITGVGAFALGIL